jgi:multimeric flavodoxin WrbA
MEKRLKILAICGSPHKGNTYKILRMLKKSNPEIDFKILMLSELNLMDCLGCYSCINTGEENCPLKDDRDMIIKEMEEADGTIFASPTYARTISALMKKLVERISYISHRPMFFGKYAMALVTCAGFGADLTSKYLSENFTQSGFNFVSPVELKVATKSEIERDHNHKKALEGYKKLINAIGAHEKFEPSLGQLVYFNIFKSISEYNKTKGWADHKFYKDKKDFYTNIRIPFVKNKIAKWIAAREIKKMMANK